MMTNDRRLYLIRKKFSVGLSEGEKVELEILQQQMEEVRTRARDTMIYSPFCFWTYEKRITSAPDLITPINTANDEAEIIEHRRSRWGRIAAIVGWSFVGILSIVGIVMHTMF